MPAEYQREPRTLALPKCTVLPISITGQQSTDFSLRYPELIGVELNPARIHWASTVYMVPRGTRGIQR